MKGVGRPSLGLYAEGVIWVVHHPMGNSGSGGQGEGECIAPGDLRWGGDTNERVIPGSTCARRGDTTISGGSHIINKMQAGHRRITRQDAARRKRQHTFGAILATEISVK